MFSKQEELIFLFLWDIWIFNYKLKRFINIIYKLNNIFTNTEGVGVRPEQQQDLICHSFMYRCKIRIYLKTVNLYSRQSRHSSQFIITKASLK